jgi:hypothetical protein
MWTDPTSRLLAMVAQHPSQTRGIEVFRDATVSRVVLQEMLTSLSRSSIKQRIRDELKRTASGLATHRIDYNPP